MTGLLAPGLLLIIVFLATLHWWSLLVHVRLLSQMRSLLPLLLTGEFPGLVKKVKIQLVLYQAGWSFSRDQGQAKSFLSCSQGSLSLPCELRVMMRSSCFLRCTPLAASQ